jgi:acetyl-CoA carboxylase carboxyl transferase subunit alpha
VVIGEVARARLDRRRNGAYARTRNLYGGLSRSRRLILWATRHAQGSDGHEDHRPDLIKFGDHRRVIPDAGGAHRDPAATIASARRALGDALKSLHNLGPDELRNARAEKFLAMGRKI